MNKKKKAIKDYCRDCAGGTFLEVLFCHLTDCPLYPYRTGYSARQDEISLAAAMEKHPDVAKELRPLLSEARSSRLTLHSSKCSKGTRVTPTTPTDPPSLA